jgi:hypothetical protein
MAKAPTKPSLIPLPLKVGEGWYIRAKFWDGREEHINGFQSGDEAMEWINSGKLEEWMKARGQS